MAVRPLAASFVHVFVLGVDPGLSRCGYAVVESRRVGGRVVSVGVIRTDPSEPTVDRLVEIQREIGDILDEFRPDEVAVERIFVQHNLQSAIRVAQVSGIVLAEAGRRGCAVSMYSPNEMKAAVTGDGRADKEQVGSMITQLLGLSVMPSPADAADAAGLALCHLAHSGGAARLARSVR